MKSKSISFFIVIALLVFSGIVSWNSYFRNYWQSDTVSIHLFPKVIGEWSSEEIPITDKEKAILETDNVFTRKYATQDGKEVYLFVVYSQNNRKVSHPPEICYVGSGVSVVEKSQNTIEGGVNQVKKSVIEVNSLKLSKGQTEQIAFYWFKVGNSFTQSYLKQQILIVLKSFLQQPASSALIRISATVKEKNDLESVSQIKEFGQLIVPYLWEYLP